MDSSGGSSARVGIVFFISILLLMTGVYMVGNGLIFQDYTTYQAEFPSTPGLRKDARVFLSGVQVGKVEEITFSRDLNSRSIMVTLAVQSEFANRIRENSMAWIQTEGLLGDKSVGITLVGDTPRPQLAPGARIETMDRSLMADLIGEDLTRDTGALLENLIALIQEVNQGEGSLGQLLKNDELYQNLNRFAGSLATTSDELTEVTRDIKDIIAEVRTQKGTLGKLIFSEKYAAEFTSAVQNVNRLMGSLADVMDPIRKGEGTIGKLVSDDALYHELKRATAGVSSVTERIDSSLEAMTSNRSVLGRIVEDPEMGQRFERLLSTLERGAGGLERVLAKIDSGDGSLGMLLNDPSIAASLRDLFLGVSESSTLLAIVRRAEEDGREYRLRDEQLARSTSGKETRENLKMMGQEPRETILPATAKEGEGKPVTTPQKEKERK